MSAHDELPSHAPLLPARASPSRPKLLFGWAAALSAALCMSAYVLIGERTTVAKQYDASGFLLLRQLIATMCMLVVAAAKHGCSVKLLVPPSAVLADVKLLGLLQFLNALLFLHGISLAGSFVAAVCQLSVPVITFAYTALAGMERPSLRRALALLAVVAGCLLTAIGHTLHAVTVPPPTTTSRRLLRQFKLERHRTRHLEAPLPLLGVALLLVQCTSFVGIVVVQKRVLSSQPVSLTVMWSYLLATALTGVYCALVGSLRRLGRQLESATDALSIGFAAVVGTLVYFELIGVASKHLPPTLVACSVALEPLTVSALGGVVLGHTTSPLEMGGYAVASVGVCALALLGDEPAAPPPVRRSPSGASFELLENRDGRWFGSQQHASTCATARARSIGCAVAEESAAGLVLAMAGTQPGG